MSSKKRASGIDLLKFEKRKNGWYDLRGRRGAYKVINQNKIEELNNLSNPPDTNMKDNTSGRVFVKPRRPPKAPSDQNVQRHRYLLTALLGNTSLLTNNQQNARLRNLLNSARAIRLSVPHQMAAWSGSFLETSGFEQGARRKGTRVVDRQTKDTDPLLLIKDKNGQPRTEPTLFIKSAFSADWLKGSNWARARAVYPTNVVENMKKLINFTETLKINNINIAGKTKGTTEIQPDIIISIPNRTTGQGGDIHVYELKIGLGKKEVIPAEAIQLAKMKFILDSYLKNLGWTTHIHFLPWLYAQNPNNSPNFVNWKVSKIKLVKNIANKFISQLNAGYNIKVINRTNSVLTRHLNITTINALMNTSRAGRINTMARAAGAISRESQVSIINRLSSGGRNIAPVVNYLQSVADIVVQNQTSRSKGMRSIAGIWRNLQTALQNAKNAYIIHTPKNNLPPNFQGNKPSGSTAANVSGASNPNITRNSELKLAELNRIIKIIDIFIESVNRLRAINQSTPMLSPESLNKFRRTKAALNNAGEVSSRRFSNNNLNAVINNAGNFEKTYAAFLAQHGPNAGNAMNNRILQLSENNPNFSNYYLDIITRKEAANRKK